MTPPDSASAGGQVAELWRYPVKSLQGERVETLDVAANRIPGDRDWALLDAETGKVLSAKTVPALLEAAASSGSGGTTLRLPSGDEIVAAESADTDRLLSDWLDRPVTLRPATAARNDLVYEMTFDPPDDRAQRVDIPVPPGTFLDLAAVHLLSARSLASCAGHHPDGSWDRRRFRPNVLVATPNGEAADEWPEDAWVGHRVRLGTACLDVLLRTVRCAMPLRAQPPHQDEPGLARDVELFRVMSERHDNHLGVYASVVEPGRVAVGDAVIVE